ncbi:hypothetical protein Angca_009934, partial [Angiostrongylus cantonensis]
RAAWGAFKSIGYVVNRKKNTRLRAYLFESTVLPALMYALETWSLRKQDERSLSVIERAVEKTMLGVSRLTQIRDWNPKLRPTSMIEYRRCRSIRQTVEDKRWAGHVMRMNDYRWTRAVSDWIP